VSESTSAGPESTSAGPESTTAGPTAAPDYNAAAVTITKALTDIFNGGSVETSKTAFTQALTSIGANVNLAGAFIDSVSALDAVLVENPSGSQETQIIDQITIVIQSGVALVKSQPGFENLSTDPEIINDPQFSPFVARFNEVIQRMEESKGTLESAFNFFPGITQVLGEFFAAMADISKQVSLKKSGGL
jgi:hypothetical protein